MQNRQNENGNVLFLILTVVFLFGALTYAATSSSRYSGNSDAGRETTRVSSAELIQQAGFIENMIVRLTSIGNCSFETLSFERSPYDGSDADYYNPSSPANFTCHIFHPNGGGVSDRLVDDKPFHFSGSRYIQDVGLSIGAPADRAELYAMLEVSRIMCLELNDNFHINNPGGSPPVLDGFGDDDLFNGTFDGTNAVNSSATETHGVRSFCGSVGNEYRYIHVLSAR